MDEETHRPRKAVRRVQLGRYVLSVDGQAKAGYPQRNAADAEAERIRQAFPRVSVTVTDGQQEDTSAGMKREDLAVSADAQESGAE